MDKKVVKRRKKRIKKVRKWINKKSRENVDYFDFV